MLLPTGLSLPTAERNCPAPDGWVAYTVQEGDTLYDIARAVGSTVEELAAANCLTGSGNITPGLNVYLPQSPSQPVATSAPLGPTGTPPAPVGCSAPGVRIIAPSAGQLVTGMFTLVGAAVVPTSGAYVIEIRADLVPDFMPYSRATTSVPGGVLAEINSDLFGNGLYWIRLSVQDRHGAVTESCAIPVFFG